ncbi:hypothetical protein RFI_28553 [Reticulomyxa filosa]|uniref:G-protein coupled receptors family 3 profile domain-containing protein n=1 Tax=Reticulomyxa filosa TaxID=46433 RepID=X6M5T6_RETFI|nr:hypothetical protein RFI_28553 [Reticulomyxa filosa]|eukprot:ETO08832.1 hypothetical protein RFI_28553 [Reticulomyxa filosa]
MSIPSSQVCSTTFSDMCACSLAQLSASTTLYTTCFDTYVCAFNASTSTFCSGHGNCIFNESRCACNDDYGLKDCSAKYQVYQVSPLISVPLISIGALIMLVCLGLIYWVWKYRTTSEVKAMSITFTNIMLFGCAMVCAGVIVLGLGWNSANCIILEWFSFVGITLVLACAGIKAFRIASIFNRSTLSGKDLSDATLFKYLCGTTMLSVLLMIIYTILNFTEGLNKKKKGGEERKRGKRKRWRKKSFIYTYTYYYIYI